jgi:cytochrome P450
MPQPMPLRIQDFDDASFNPSIAFNRGHGSDLVRDPYPQLARMRDQAPVQAGDLRLAFGMAPDMTMQGLDHVMVLGYDEVMQVLGDQATYANSVYLRNLGVGFGRSITTMDPPEHPKYRKLFQRAFTPAALAKWGKEVIEPVVHKFIDRIAHKGHAELVSEFTAHYPFHFIYGQLDLPEDELEIFHKLGVGLMCITSDPARGMEASRKLGDYFSLLIEERRRGSGEDLISVLSRAEVDGERLPHEVVVSFFRQLLNAGGDTTYRGTSILLTGLLNNPAQLEAVRQDRSLVPAAIDEALRWNAPIMALSRTPTRDVELSGVLLKQGAKLDVVIGSANRDPKRWSDRPEQYDLFRRAERHNAFGYGAHVCIGQHVARLEMALALNALLDRLPNLRLDPEHQAPEVIGLTMRAPDEVHVRFG